MKKGFLTDIAVALFSPLASMGIKEYNVTSTAAQTASTQPAPVLPEHIRLKEQAIAEYQARNFTM